MSSQATLRSSEPEVLDRGALSKARLWYESVRQQSRLIGTYSPDVSTSRAGTRLGSLRPLEDPIFVLGCPRSGTTYLGGLMAEVRDSTYIFEPQILKYYVRLVVQGKVSQRHASTVYRQGPVSYTHLTLPTKA